MSSRTLAFLPAIDNETCPSLGHDPASLPCLEWHFQILAESLIYSKPLELYKKDLHDPDSHDDVITNLELDILECEVKWALESITEQS